MTFKLTDLPTAAFLSVRGLKFLGCDLASDTQARFVFSDPEERGWELLSEYEAEGECSARAFNRHFRVLRAAAIRAVGRG